MYQLYQSPLYFTHALPIEKSLDHEPQCGFRPERGCIDTIYTVKMALRKRQEYGKESWVFSLGLVKAFDRVPRQLLWFNSTEIRSSTKTDQPAEISP